MVLAVIYILQPSLLELVMFILVVDLLALLIIGPIMSFVFIKYYCEGNAHVCFGIEDTTFAQLPKNERVELLRKWLSLPKPYSVFLIMSSYIKAIPAFLYIVFAWKYDRSPWFQFIQTISIASVAYVFIGGCAYYDAQAKITLWIKELHQRFDLKEEFEDLMLENNPHLGQGMDILMQVAIIIFTVILQIVSLVDTYKQPLSIIITKLIFIGLMGLILSTWIWVLSRKQLFNGLLDIFDEMNKLNFKKSYPVIAINASPLLARFTMTFNELVKRIANSEKQLRQLVFREAEKSRYQALGEISALVAHDLSGPLHVSQYCLDEVERLAPDESLQKYMNQMRLNLSMAIELVTSLRTRLKNEHPKSDSTQFEGIHQHTLRLLKTQFGAHVVEKIKIDLDPRLLGISLVIPPIDLMQILDNLYRNSIRNFIENNNEQPLIRIELEENNGDHAVLTISDNGTGLTPEKFDEFTDSDAIRPEMSQQSLGLRLIRRLIEQQGGQLNLAPSSPSIPSGTRFRLTLPSKK